MALDTFYPPVAPSPGSKRTPKLKILTAEFGDGYQQSVPDGLNHIRLTHELRWDVLTRDQAETIEAFLTAQGGTTPFFYTPSGSPLPIRFTCQEWARTDNAAGLCAFTANLVQSFNLGS